MIYESFFCDLHNLGHTDVFMSHVLWPLISLHRLGCVYLWCVLEIPPGLCEVTQPREKYMQTGDFTWNELHPIPIVFYSNPEQSLPIRGTAGTSCVFTLKDTVVEHSQQKQWGHVLLEYVCLNASN